MKRILLKITCCNTHTGFTLEKFTHSDEPRRTFTHTLLLHKDAHIQPHACIQPSMHPCTSPTCSALPAGAVEEERVMRAGREERSSDQTPVFWCSSCSCRLLQGSVAGSSSSGVCSGVPPAPASQSQLHMETSALPGPSVNTARSQFRWAHLRLCVFVSNLRVRERVGERGR